MTIAHTIIRTIVTILAVAVGIVGVAMTFRYGQLSFSGADSLLYSLLFASFDGVKCLLPSLATMLVLAGQKKWVIGSRIAYLFLATLSFAAHVGLLVTVKTHDAAIDATAKSRHDLAQVQVDRLNNQIANIGTIRPLGSIQADVNQMQRDPVFYDTRRSNRCTDDTAHDSQLLCKKYRLATGELANRIKLDQLQTDLDKAQADLKASTTTAKLGDANAAIDGFAKKTGLDSLTVMFILAVLLAIGIEFCSSQLLGMAVAAGYRVTDSHFPVTKTEPQNSLEAVILQPLMADNGGINSRNGDLESLPNPALDKLDAKAWIPERMTAHRTGSLVYRTAYEMHAADARAAGMLPSTENAFSRALKANGFKTERQARVLIILGAAIRGERARGGLKLVK